MPLLTILLGIPAPSLISAIPSNLLCFNFPQKRSLGIAVTLVVMNYQICAFLF